MLRAIGVFGGLCRRRYGSSSLSPPDYGKVREMMITEGGGASPLPAPLLVHSAHCNL